MRNAERIDDFCYQFGQLWKENAPDMRFGQLILNFIGWNGFQYDPWFLEQDEIIAALQQYFSEKKGGTQ